MDIGVCMTYSVDIVILWATTFNIAFSLFATPCFQNLRFPLWHFAKTADFETEKTTMRRFLLCCRGEKHGVGDATASLPSRTQLQCVPIASAV
jgi:hypothetical protein